MPGGFHSAANLEPESDSPQGASESEAAQRRASMRKAGAIQGGGEGDGTPTGQLSSAAPQADVPHADTPESIDNPAQSRPNLRVIQGGKSDSASQNTPGKDPNTPNRSTDRSRDNQNRKNSPDTQPTVRPGGGKGTAKDSKESDSGKKATAGAAAAGGFVGGLISRYAGGATKFVGQNRKGFLVGGGIAGLVTTLMLGFASLIPLKIEAMIKNIYGKEYARVEHLLERRAERIFIKYSMQNALNPEGGIVATGNPLGDLYKTWRVQQVEKGFLGDEKLKITKGNTPRSIKVTLPDGTQEFDSESKFAKYLGKDLAGRQGRQFIRQVVKNQTKWYQFYKRRHLRQWMRQAWDISKWRFFDKTTPDKDVEKTFDKTMAEDLAEGYGRKVAGEVTCMVSSECPEGTPDSPPDSKVIDPTAEGQQTGDAVGKAVTEAASDPTAKVADEAATSAFSKLLSSKLATVLGTKVIPVVGWIDAFARIDNFLWNDRIEGLINGIRSTQYAATFATWAIISDQIKSGDVSTAEVNTALSKLDNMEKGAAYYSTFLGDENRGTQVPQSRLMGSSVAKSLQSDYQFFAGATQHEALSLYLATGGKIFDALGGALNWLVKVGTPVTYGAESRLSGWVLNIMLEWIVKLLGPVIGAGDDGSVIINAVNIGGDVSANDFMQNELGGVPGNAKQLGQVDDAIAAENSLQKVSLMDRLFSTDNPNSFVSRLAVTLPSSPLAALQSSAHQAIAFISNPVLSMSGGLQLALNATSSSARADDTEDKYGVKQFYVPEDQANALVDQKQLDDLQKAADKAKADGRSIDQIQPSDCPDAASGQANLCKANIVAIQALKANETTNDDGGLNSDTASPSN
jgi:hypothetical protein